VLALHQFTAERPDPRTRVQDHELTGPPPLIPASHGNARGVATVACGMSSGSGDRTPRSPKGDRVRYPFRQRRVPFRANLRKIRQVGGDSTHDPPAADSSAKPTRDT